MRVSSPEVRPALWLATAVVCTAMPAAEFSGPVDCLPDRVVEWRAAEPDPAARFGATSLPGIVLGPPGDSVPTTGSTSVASLGHGGTVTLEYTDIAIVDGPGPDFIVFENAFYVGFTPSSPSDPWQIFAEPGVVEVSSDGASWVQFPFDAQALDEARGSNIDAELYDRLQGLAGITPTFTGNWTVPNDPSFWDPLGQGGISGAGGDAFDLATVGLTEARFVRITDADSRNGAAGSAEGFDVETVVVLHGLPRTPQTSDRDGDRLSDLYEEQVSGSNPDLADTDGDGMDDGREMAACRDPLTVVEDPLFAPEPRLWALDDGGCSEWRWAFLGSGVSYDIVRGELDSLIETSSHVDLGNTVCLAGDHPAVRWSCDATAPLPGEGFFYVVRVTTETAFGRSSALLPREATSGCP